MGVLPGPVGVLPGPVGVLPGPVGVLPGPVGVLPGPVGVLPGPVGVLPGPVGVLPGPVGVLPGPVGVLPGPVGVLPGPVGVLPGPVGVLPGPVGVLPGPVGVPPARPGPARGRGRWARVHITPQGVTSPVKPPKIPLIRAAAALAALALGTAVLPSVSAVPAAEAQAAAEAQWIDRATVVWKVEHTAATAEELRYAGGGTLRLAPASLTDDQKAAYPHLAGRPAYRLDPRDRDKAATALRGPLAAVQRAADDGHVLHRTGVQIPGVLDDLYADRARRARLGPVFHGGRPTLSVWAPTARSVSLDLDGRTVAMRRDARSGVWSVTGTSGWRDKPYRYRVRVWAPSVGRTVTNEVTDPYATALTADSARSLVTDLADPRLAPAGWDSLKKPGAVPSRDARIQELHIRDFSIADRTSAHPGRYLAFTDQDSDGMRHLRRLARSGTSYVHLLPAFDFGTVPERRSDQARPGCDLADLPADSDQQQKCVAATADRDGYNWGYDPLHYTVPEGSYASDPDGPARIREFRRMVQGLAHAGLRTVMDVVYNHTVAAGQDDKSVLDRIVPGYYQRLLDDGSVATSTCCPGTAPEHAMMGKLVVDSLVTWARQYKVDGFRFDLMGHHPKANILAVRKALDALTPAKDGVDGTSIILYGEGWNFGEAADDARFVQATQRHMAATGIATFSDRARDAVRGGGPFDEDPRVQGFASGLFTDPNGSPANGGRDEQRARLLHAQDLIKVGLSGNLADYTFTDTGGRRVKGSEVDYNGSPAGYAAAPATPSPTPTPMTTRPSTTRSPTSCPPSPRPPTGPGRRSWPWPPPPSPRARHSARPAAICCAPSRWTATPTTAATGSTPSTGPARTATASAGDCPRRPTTSPSGRTPSPC